MSKIINEHNEGKEIVAIHYKDSESFATGRIIADDEVYIKFQLTDPQGKSDGKKPITIPHHNIARIVPQEESSESEDIRTVHVAKKT